MTVGEAMSFATQRRWQDQKRMQLRALLAELVVVELRAGPVVERYAELDAWAKSRGRTIGKNDLWIAATALAAEGMLLTNDQDFAPLEEAGLRLVYVAPIESKRT